MSVAVVGSLNVDRFARVERLPQPGETVMATDTFTRFGGKGANQAVAAARLGQRVHLIGALGSDAAGAEYRERLQEEGIDAGAVVSKPGDTGSAAILVERSGENCIVVAAGANGRLEPADILAARERIATAQVLLLQLEVPLPAIAAAVQIAAEAKVPVVLNPSPWRPDFPFAQTKLHTVIVNAQEVRAWLGEPAYPAGLPLEQVVVTQGGSETLGFTAHRRIVVAPRRVQPVDTVGAGDAFAGAFAVALAERFALEQALEFANAAGALATLAVGAQEAMPTRSAVDARLRDGAPRA